MIHSLPSYLDQQPQNRVEDHGMPSSCSLTRFFCDPKCASVRSKNFYRQLVSTFGSVAPLGMYATSSTCAAIQRHITQNRSQGAECPVASMLAFCNMSQNQNIISTNLTKGRFQEGFGCSFWPRRTPSPALLNLKNINGSLDNVAIAEQSDTEAQRSGLKCSSRMPRCSLGPSQTAWDFPQLLNHT